MRREFHTKRVNPPIPLLAATLVVYDYMILIKFSQVSNPVPGA